MTSGKVLNKILLTLVDLGYWIEISLQTLYKDSFSVNEYFDKMKGIIDDLDAIEGLVSDKNFVITIYNG